MLHPPSCVPALALQRLFFFPQGAVANEEIVLRWIHFVSGIMWIGLLYFFNLIAVPLAKELDPPLRLKLYPALMSRAMWWFRWSSVITVLVGLRYFILILQADASREARSGMAWRWLGYWFIVWIVAYAFLYPLQMPMKGLLDKGWVRAIPIAVVVIAASWVVLRLNVTPNVSNMHLAISVGGGLGLLMLLNVWGVVWRAQKRLIQWMRISAESGAPLPPEAARLARWSFVASRTAFWLSLPMLFLMGAAEHYPFLGG